MNRQKREYQILDAALRVFARQGYPHSNVSDLVKEAGVSRGTFYLYFKSKNEIFDVLLDRFMSEIIGNVSSLGFVRFIENPYQDNSIVHELSVCLAKYRLLARIIMNDSRSLAGSHRQKIQKYIKQLYNVLEHNLSVGAKAASVENFDAFVVARCLIGATKEFLAQWEPDRQKFDLEKKIESLLTFTLGQFVSQDDDHSAQEHARIDDPDDLPIRL